MSTPADTTILLRQAFQLLKIGDKQQAKALVADVLKRDPNNADAWYLASFLTDIPDKKTQALERALAVNPHHTQAQKLLAKLQQNKESIDDLLTGVPITPAKTKINKESGLIVILAAGILLIIVVSIGLLLGGKVFNTAQQPTIPAAVLMPSDTPTQTYTATFTFTPTFTSTATSTPTSTPSNTKTATPTTTHTATYTPSPTDEPTSTDTSVPTDTPEPTETNTPKPTRTRIPTRTPLPEMGTLDNPVPFGQFISLTLTDDPGSEIKVRLSKVYRGEEAKKRIREGAFFTPNLPADRHFILIFMEVQYIKGDLIWKINDPSFILVSKGKPLDYRFGTAQLLIAPDPAFLYEPSVFKEGLRAGEVHSGWITREAFINDPNPLVVLGMDTSDKTGGFYFSTMSKR